MKDSPKAEQWTSKIGVVLAVAGSAVGFGNFLRFPGLAAQFGGGAFMVAYFCSFLLLGIPLSWIEWAIGRHAGSKGAHSVAGAYHILTKSAVWKYIGIVSILTPMVLAMYYLYLEGWTLGYAYNILMGNLQFDQAEGFTNYFVQFTGLEGNGAAFDLSNSNVLIFYAIALILNIVLLYRGIQKGIEWFCRVSMPILLVLSLIVIVRVLTLGTPDASHPNRNLNEGLGYMWNPNKIVLQIDGKTVDMLPANSSEEEHAQLIAQVKQENPNKTVQVVDIGFIGGLSNPQLWLNAAGQIFFSLSIGFGLIMTYTSYIKKDEDIALSAITSNAANEVAEVGIAGMMIIPASVAFLGVAAAAGASTFGLGFNVLPQVFAAMPGGQFFGFIFFALLFLAALTSSIALMQPSVAFLEEFWPLSRKQSVSIAITLLSVGTLIVAWFTGDDLIALDTLDFFYGTLSLYISCGLMIYVFTRVWGTENGIKELNHGGLIQIPRFMPVIMNYVTPSILIIIFGSWLYTNIVGEVSPQINNVINLKIGAILPLVWTAIVYSFFAIVTYTSRTHKNHHDLAEEMDEDEINQRTPLG